jgi:hypothetical protein
VALVMTATASSPSNGVWSAAAARLRRSASSFLLLLPAVGVKLSPGEEMAIDWRRKRLPLVRSYGG